MFHLFKRNRDASAKEIDAEQESGESREATDPALIAVIAAAVARFREQDRFVPPAVGFVVRRVRRV